MSSVIHSSTDPVTASPTSVVAGTSDSSGLRELTVLYAEDNADARDLLSGFFRRRFRSVYIAEDGRAGIEAFQAHRPDIVVTDVLMPELDGISMAAEIKRLDRRTPIIMTTAFSDSRYLLRAIEAGVDAYVIKPVATFRLLEVLERCAASLLAERSQRLYAAVLEAVAEAIVITDADLRIRTANPALTRITGLAVESLVGRPLDVLAAEGTGEHWTADPRDLVNREVELRRADGQTFSALVSLQPVRSSDGRVISQVLSFVDISVEKEHHLFQLKLLSDHVAELANEIQARPRPTFEVDLERVQDDAALQDFLSRLIRSQAMMSEPTWLMLARVEQGGPTSREARSAFAAELDRSLLRRTDVALQLRNGDVAIIIQGVSTAEVTAVAERLLRGIGDAGLAQTARLLLGVDAVKPTDSPEQWLARTYSALARAMRSSGSGFCIEPA